MRHELKADIQNFEDIVDGEKGFDIRKGDRPFNTGDVLWLRETVYSGMQMAKGKPLEYTGREAKMTVHFIMRGGEHGFEYGLKEGYVAMDLCG